MAIDKRYRQVLHLLGRREPVQTITASGASALQTTTIRSYGVTVIEQTGTGAGHTYTLDKPTQGVVKTLVVHGPGGSTLEANVQSHSSAVTIGETTGNRIVVSTAADTNGSAIVLIGESSASWLLGAPLPTGVTIAAATQL